MDILITKHADKHSRVELWAVDHAHVACSVVEVLQLLWKGPKKGGQVMVVQQSLVPRSVRKFGGRKARSQLLG